MTNRALGPVQFIAEKIDADSGFQQRSIVELYSTILEDGVYNLLHAHVEDMNAEVTINVLLHRQQ